SGQVMVPTSLSPSFLSVKVAVRCCPPISYSHFHVPTGSDLSSAALVRPQTPRTNATERIAFMLASTRNGGWEAGQRRPPPPADNDFMDATMVGQLRHQPTWIPPPESGRALWPFPEKSWARAKPQRRKVNCFSGLASLRESLFGILW